MAADDVVIWDGTSEDNAFATAGNYVGAAIPQSTGGVIFPALAANTAHDVDGSDQSAILMATTMVEPGCYLNFGSRDTYLKLDTDAFHYAGSGKGFFELTGCAEARLTGGSSGASGYTYGMSIKGATIASLIINVGSGNTVGIAALEDETATVTTMQAVSGIIAMGDAVTCTTLYVDGANVTNSSNVTTATISSGTYRQVKNKPTTLNVIGSARVYYDSATAPTTVTLRGNAILDMSQDSVAKTFATVNLYDNAQIYDPNNVLTITTLTRYKGGTLAVS